jgi:hypothetical protein
LLKSFRDYSTPTLARASWRSSNAPSQEREKTDLEKEKLESKEIEREQRKQCKPNKPILKA